MNNLDSDLEEGEIIDDSPLSPEISKREVLSKRYSLKSSKTRIHKHKKGCKHAIRHHAKKISMVKKSTVKKKISPKIHHKPTCKYEKSRRIFNRLNNKSDTHTSSRNVFFPRNSLIERKNSIKFIPHLKNISKNFNEFKSSKRAFVGPELSNAKKSKNKIDKFKYKIDLEDTMSTNFEHLAVKPGAYLDLIKTSDDDSIVELEVCDSTPLPPIIDLSNSPDDKSITKLNSNNDENIFSNTKFKDEDIEDIEELRRIAFATCANRKVHKELENIAQNIDHPREGNDLSDINNDFNLPQVINNQTADNYEVVDMDLDEEIQDSLETVSISSTNEILEPTENLYIDTNLETDFLQNEKESFSEPQTVDDSDDEDFKISILRAELINSMYRKKFFKENAKYKKRNAVNSKKFNYQKQNLQFSNKRLKSAKQFLCKRFAEKLVNVNNKNSSEILEPTENLYIIDTNPATSDFLQNEKLFSEPQTADDGDDDFQENILREKLINSIYQKEALDENAKCKKRNHVVNSKNYQKQNVQFSYKRLKSPKHFWRRSSLNKLVNVNKNNANKAILPIQANKPIDRFIITVNGESSDEETKTASENPLDSISARILVKKTKLSSPGTQSSKNGSIHSPLDDLKKLKNMICQLQNTLKKKRESMANLTEDVISKKFHYMKSKCTAQNLKAQLVAAENIRKVKLFEWSKSSYNLKLIKLSLTNLEKKIDDMQNLCSKIGSSLQGHYKLPMLLSGNKQS